MKNEVKNDEIMRDYFSHRDFMDTDFAYYCYEVAKNPHYSIKEADYDSIESWENADYDFLNKALECEQCLKLIAWKNFLESNTNLDSFVKSLNYYQKTKIKFYCELRDLSILKNIDKEREKTLKIAKQIAKQTSHLHPNYLEYFSQLFNFIQNKHWDFENKQAECIDKIENILVYTPLKERKENWRFQIKFFYELWQLAEWKKNRMKKQNKRVRQDR